MKQPKRYLIRKAEESPDKKHEITIGSFATWLDVEIVKLIIEKRTLLARLFSQSPLMRSLIRTRRTTELYAAHPDRCPRDYFANPVLEVDNEGVTVSYELRFDNDSSIEKKERKRYDFN